MSEKYSTEDFVLWITASCDINAVKSECDVSDACPECAKQRDAIIDRLRAADRLCEVAKEVIREKTVDRLDDVPTEYKDTSIAMRLLHKAIADYEGEK